MGVVRFAAVCFVVGISARAQLRVDSANVIVEVRVSDSKGRAVAGLPASAFRLTENGSPKSLVAFYPPEIESQAAAGSRPKNLSARYVSLTIDQANTQQSGRNALVKALRAYADQDIPANTFVSIYAIGSQLRLIAPFTQDKAALQDAVSKFFDNPNDGAFTSSDKSHLDQELRQLIEEERRVATTHPDRADVIRAQRDSLQEAAWAQTGMQARTLFAGLRAMAHAGGILPGRKTIVLFSEGFGHAPDAAEQAALVVDAASRSNTTIYVVDPAGGTKTPVESSNSAQFSSNESVGGRGRNSRRNVPNTVNEQMREIAESTRRGRSASGSHADPFDAMRHIAVGIELSDLTSLAENTGGYTIQGQNDLRRALKRIDDESAEVYTLVYRPDVAEYDGKFRKIKVDVEDGKYRLRYRSGYWAIAPGDSEKLSPAAAQVLASITDGTMKATGNLKLNAAILFAKSGGFDVPISLRVPARTPNALLIVTVRDAAGKLIDAGQRYVTDTDRQEDSFQVFSRLKIPALEKVQVLAALQFTDGSASLGARDVEVSGGDISVTSIVLTDRIQLAAEAETVFDSLKVGKYQLILPVEPVFHASDLVTVYAGFIAETASDLHAEVVVRSAAGAPVQSSPLEALNPANGEKQFFLIRQVRLGSIQPGTYSMEIRVVDPATKAAAMRSVSFQVN